MKILVLNAGSSSMKFKLYDMGADAAVLAEGNCQRVGLPGSELKYVVGGEKSIETLELRNHEQALDTALRVLTRGEKAPLSNISELDAVGHRVSNGGPNYVSSVSIDDDVIAEIERMSDATPLHTPPQIATIKACGNLLGRDFPMVAGFDTAFHQTMPPTSYLYPIPYEFYEKYTVRKLGFHGLSHQFVSERYAQLTGKNLTGVKMITCHLGGGDSLTAVDGGKSVDNTFGFGTGEGPLCGTRAGSFDYTAMYYLMTKTGRTMEEMQAILSRDSGLLGLSGVSSDEKELEELALAGNERAKLALDVLFHQIRKYIGAYAFEMGGLDALVFTGGIGENSDYSRAGICAGLERFGIVLDEKLNKVLNRSEGRISMPGSSVDVWIIPTNEELVIARDTLDIVSKAQK